MDRILVLGGEQRARDADSPSFTLDLPAQQSDRTVSHSVVARRRR